MIHTIIVKDPHGHIAAWLGQPPIPGAHLTVQLKGSWRARRRFRRQLRQIAAGRKEHLG